MGLIKIILEHIFLSQVIRDGNVSQKLSHKTVTH